MCSILMLYPRRIEAQTKTVDIFSCTYAHTSYYAKDIFPAHTHIPLFTLETPSLPHTHILPATDIFSCTHTYILLFMLETSCLEYTNILLALLQMFFVAHTHILPASLYASFLALTHVLCLMLRERHLFLHIHREEKRCALKNLVPVKPNRMLQWVFKIPGLFKVQF